MAYAASIDGLVLQALCEEPGPWTTDEVGREFNGVAALDALDRLRQRGLIVRMEGGFLTTTAAGRYAHVVGKERA